MPLLHKSTVAPPERPGPASAEADPTALLAQLIGLASPEAAGAVSRTSRAARRREARYDQVVRLIATGIGLLACATAWLVGAYFTLSWFASIGMAWAAAAIAPLTTLVQGTASPTLSSDVRVMPGSAALLVWAIPLGLTLAEIGFDPGRAGGLASRLLWGVFLIADATTSALGIYPVLSHSTGSDPLATAIAAIIGLVLALVPEKLARRLIRENL